MFSFGDELDHNLLNPNQILNYVIPFWDNSFDKNRGLLIKISGELDIPLIMKGTTVGFMSRAPTKEELGTFEHVVIVSPEHWEPTSIQLGEVTSLHNGLGIICLDDGSHSYLNPK